MNLRISQLKFKPVTGLALLMLWALCPLVRAQQKPEELAEQSAESWLALVDSGNSAQSWEEAASIFKAAVTEEQWKSALRASRDPLGKVLTRKWVSARYTKTLSGAPDGEYVVIQYESSFEHKRSAIETVTPMMDQDGNWRVSGCYIK
jgi:hypothetical protein